MISLDSDQWKRFEHCGGSAENIPTLVRQLLEDDSEENLSELLWEHLFHQYSTYSATYAVIPHLIELMKCGGEETRAYILNFIGVVEAWTTERTLDSLPSEVVTSYRQAIAEAAPFSLALLEEPAQDSVDSIYRIADAAGLNGYKDLARIIPGFSAEEFTCLCPRCGEENIIWPQGNRLVSYKKDPVFHKDQTPIPIKPDGPDNETQTFLLGLVEMAGDQTLATLIPFLFGSATCPHCSFVFLLANRLLEEERQLN